MSLAGSGTVVTVDRAGADLERGHDRPMIRGHRADRIARVEHLRAFQHHGPLVFGYQM